MYLFGILVGFYFILVELKRHKLTPLIIFSVLWLSILLLSAFRFYGLDKPSDQAYLVIAVGMIGFGIGYLLLNRFTIRLHRGLTSYVISDKLILGLSLITIGLYFTDFAKVISYLLNGQTLAYIRALSQDGTSVLYTDRGNLEIVIRTFIIQPFALALQVIVATEFWNGKRKWLVIDAIIIILRLLSEGSRSLLLYLGLHMIIVFILDNKASYYINLYKTKKTAKHSKRVLRIMVLIASVLIVVTTLSRSGERALRTSYYYFSMEPTMLGIWLQKIKEYGYGLASLNGLVFPFLFLFKNIFKLPTYPSYWYNNIFLLIDDTDKTWQVISSFDNTRANAYVSIFWFAFLDGGYIGTFIILFIMGMIYSLMYNHTYKHRNKKSFCVYSYLLQGLIFSFVRLQFADVSYALGFVFLLLFAFRRKGANNGK